MSQEQNQSKKRKRDEAGVEGAGLEPNVDRMHALLGMSMGDFLRSHFGQKPLHVKAGGRNFESLFSREALLELAGKAPVPASKVTICRYVQGQQETLAIKPAKGKGAVFSAEQLDACLSGGYSIQLSQPQHTQDDLYTLMMDFEGAFETLSGAAACLTPPGTQAFGPHNEEDDIFILQTQGCKHWTIHAPIALPASHSGGFDQSLLAGKQPVLDVTLQAGDLLYLPRGFIHKPRGVATEFSTQVLLSVYQHSTYENFLEATLPSLLRTAVAANVDYRKKLPPAYLSFMGSMHDVDIRGTIPSLTSHQQSAFLDTIQGLVVKLGAYLSPAIAHTVADGLSRPFYARRLPPPSPHLLPRRLQEPSITTTPVLSMEGKDVGTRFRFVDKRHVRLVVGYAEGMTSVVLRHSIHNERETHMVKNHGDEEEHAHCESGGCCGGDDHDHGHEHTHGVDNGQVHGHEHTHGVVNGQVHGHEHTHGVDNGQVHGPMDHVQGNVHEHTQDPTHGHVQAHVEEETHGHSKDGGCGHDHAHEHAHEENAHSEDGGSCGGDDHGHEAIDYEEIDLPFHATILPLLLKFFEDDSECASSNGGYSIAELVTTTGMTEEHVRVVVEFLVEENIMVAV